MTPLAGELSSPPVIGQFYLVPHVQMRLDIPRHKRRSLIWMAWAPIFGPLHEDTDIGVPQQHWHFDWRFMPQCIWNEWIHDRRRYAVDLILNQVFTTGEASLKRRKCLREMPSYPGVNQVPFLAKLREKYSMQQLSCWTCPHRGLPLNGLPVKDGVVKCPGHGLYWNVDAITEQTQQTEVTA
ncbi:MAG TPA: hypothetical protein V6C63_14210 [Allocoleopsis sp.]